MTVHPPYDWPDYGSTRWRAPHRALVVLPDNLTEITGPLLGAERVGEGDHDLTRRHLGEPLGQRIVVHGRVLDGDGRPIPDTLIEVWQANAAGRYRFVTVKPGAYPWKNHRNAWRPAHIHFSVFGRAFTQRLVTQMYFPDDPLFAYDPIFASVPEPGRPRLIARFDLDATEPEWALGFRWDIVLRGGAATPFETTSP